MFRLNFRSTRIWISLALALCFALGTAARAPAVVHRFAVAHGGPFHGGRIASVTGVIGEPGTLCRHAARWHPGKPPAAA